MAIAKRKMQISKDIIEGKTDTKYYRGSNANVIYLEKSEKDISRYKVTGSLGPMRAPSNIRVTCRFDYAQGICKDYKETGRCGFGDGCVFMHDRGDYKTGWELEEEWKKEQLEKEKLIREGKYSEIKSDDEEYMMEKENDISLMCKICEEEFKSPVVTECNHYFCEICALRNYERNKNCFICKKKTNGIFNIANDFIVILFVLFYFRFIYIFNLFIYYFLFFIYRKN
jgi:RING finger protein 113A